MVIQLGDTKTSSRRLVDAHVVVRRPPTPLMAETVLALASKLRQHPAREFKASFLQLCNFFQLPVSFRPYSLRRGGAAETFLWRGAMIKSMHSLTRHTRSQPLDPSWPSLRSSTGVVESPLADQLFVPLTRKRKACH